jgi:deoxyuridine 5'-triphosphate nucleotidohydrolase
MELNEREKNIVKLINNLSEVASDEATTQEAINRILGQIRAETQENIKQEMKGAEEPQTPTIQFPQQEMAEAMRSAISDEKLRMVNEISHSIDHDRSQQALQSMGRLLFTRVREVKVPCKAHLTDAGIDFFVPDKKAWDEGFRNMVVEYSRNPVPCAPSEGVEFIDDYLEVAPRAHVAIPSGIKTIIPQGLAMMMVNKSGVATKLKLDHSACLIDSEYRDELIFCFFNHNVEPVKIEPGMKITQGLIVPVINLELNEVLNCVYDDIGKDTNRGGGFGSTDQK